MKNAYKLNTQEKFIIRELVESPQQTEEIAVRFAEKLNIGDVVAFYGDLGSGKTFFIKALCKTLNTLQEATSPTFTIINEYNTADGLTVFHFDFYRLESEAELLNIGLDEFFYGDYICFIEWADKIHDHLPERPWEVHLEMENKQPESRFITIKKIE